MSNNDFKHRGSVEEAHERAQADVHNEAEVEAAGHAQMEAERKDSSQVQAQARASAESKSSAEEHGEPKARANAQQSQQGGNGHPADPHPKEVNRQEHERLQPQEKGGYAGESRSWQGMEADDADDDADTEKRMDTLASETSTESPEARRNEAGPTDNISEHGAYGDPEEVDEIAGPPMDSVDRDDVE